MKKKITALLILMIMLLSLFSVSVSAYNSDLLQSITANYDSALAIAGRRSFYGRCNLATAYQLRAMGIYDGNLDYSGTGSSWHTYFKDVSKTSGGYNIVTISGADCLYDLVERYGNEIYNVAYSLGTGGSSGDEHVLYIRAIIDGNVYFADSFGTSYNRKYYSEGTGTVLPLDSFVAEYKRMNGNAFGCVYFTKGETEHLAGSRENPDDWANDDRRFIEGQYIVTSAILKVREKPNSHAQSIASIPNSEKITVTQITDNWGKVEYDGKTGWICLTYTQKLSVVTNDSSLSVVSLSADKQAVFSENTVTWTAKAQGSADGKYFYAFYIYKDGMKIYSGTFSTANTVSFTPTAKGSYKAYVKVADSKNNTAELFSNEIICVGEEIQVVRGDTDGDGEITANDSRIALRTTAAMKNLTGKNFVCTQSDIKKIIDPFDENSEEEI